MKMGAMRVADKLDGNGMKWADLDRRSTTTQMTDLPLTGGKALLDESFDIFSDVWPREYCSEAG